MVAEWSGLACVALSVGVTILMVAAESRDKQ